MPVPVGRFAPSPTGPLHLGSLIAAVGSHLSVRSRQGRWLLRIEDIDPPREMPGASDAILRSLEAHGLHWDGAPLYQHTRHAAYAAALDDLRARDLVYACRCSRRDLAAAGVLDCLGPCRTARYPDGAWRLRVPAQPVTYDDALRGSLRESLADSCGDFVLMRRDGLPAYQLAVVVDDGASGISEVVRGADLLDNTARQHWLQTCLGLAHPRWLHLPLAIGGNGDKLSKQNHAPALDDRHASANLRFALRALGQPVPDDALDAKPAELLARAAARWREADIPQRAVSA